MADEPREFPPTSESREQTQEIHTTPAYETETAVDHVEASTYDPYARRRLTADRLIQALYLVFGFVEAVLVVRFLLHLLGANEQAPFARFIDGLTGGLVAPFVGLFNSPTFNGSVLELHTVIAIVVYALLAWLLAKALWLIFGEPRSGLTTRSTSVDSHSRR